MTKEYSPEAYAYWRRLGFSTHTANCLARDGIGTIDQLRAADQDELRRIPNFGLVALHQVQLFLATVDRPPMPRRKIIQLLPLDGFVGALCNDGTTWSWDQKQGEWLQAFTDIPQPDDKH